MRHHSGSAATHTKDTVDAKRSARHTERPLSAHTTNLVLAGDPRTLALLRRGSAARERRAHMRALHTRDGSVSAWGALKGTGVAPTRHYRSVTYWPHCQSSLEWFTHDGLNRDGGFHSFVFGSRGGNLSGGSRLCPGRTALTGGGGRPRGLEELVHLLRCTALPTGSPSCGLRAPRAAAGAETHCYGSSAFSAARRRHRGLRRRCS